MEHQRANQLLQISFYCVNLCLQMKRVVCKSVASDDANRCKCLLRLCCKSILKSKLLIFFLAQKDLFWKLLFMRTRCICNRWRRRYCCVDTFSSAFLVNTVHIDDNQLRNFHQMLSKGERNVPFCVLKINQK